MLRAILTALITGIMTTSVALAAPEVGTPAPDFSAADHRGNAVKLSDYKGKPVVLEWHNPGCPFVKKHYNSNNMQTLQTYARDKGVTWIIVNSGAPGKQGHMTAPEADALIAEQELNADHYIIDADGAIGRQYDAKTTPHMFVINAAGSIVYMGAIDDKPSTDANDIAGAVNYVRAAIDALLASQPIQVASSQPYGCSVKYAN